MSKYFNLALRLSRESTQGLSSTGDFSGLGGSPWFTQDNAPSFSCPNCSEALHEMGFVCPKACACSCHEF